MCDQTLKLPNKETQEALKEIEEGGGQLFQTADELFGDWESVRRCDDDDYKTSSRKKIKCETHR
jgi:hypothetical protein